MRAFVTVKADSVANDTPGLLVRFKAMPTRVCNFLSEKLDFFIGYPCPFEWVKRQYSNFEYP